MRLPQEKAASLLSANRQKNSFSFLKLYPYHLLLQIAVIFKFSVPKVMKCKEAFFPF